MNQVGRGNRAERPRRVDGTTGQDDRAEQGDAGSDRTSALKALLRDLLETARETAAELSQEELDPDRLTELMNRREAAFASLQKTHAEIQGMGASESGDITTTDELKRLARELLELDRANMEMMQNRLVKLRSEINQVRLQRRSLTAYGWVDPVHAPRGAFIDTVQG